MLPSFIIFLNKAGIACASDTRATIYNLAKGKPLGLAVCPDSHIPWEEIVNNYKLGNCYRDEEHFSSYFDTIRNILSTYQFTEEMKSIPDEECEFILFGYGKDDLYPTVIKAYVESTDEGILWADVIEQNGVTNSSPFFYYTIGDFSAMSSFLYGASEEMTQFTGTQISSALDELKDKIIDAHAGSDDEESVRNRLSELDSLRCADIIMSKAVEVQKKEFEHGAETFSVEGMVDAVETIVNTNGRLEQLKSGGKGIPRQMKELAIVHQPEGMVWLVHELFAI